MKLNLGCGGHRAPAPWVNIDRYHGPGVTPDVVAPANALPFADGAASHVYCGHVLEHLALDDELPATLREIRRVLAPGGRLCVVGPDYDRALANPDWHMLLPGIIQGGERWPGDEHRWVATGPKTLAHLSAAFPAAAEVDITTLTDWPVVDDVGWQFAILT